MFRTLRIKNFRSIKDSGDLPLADLNIFIGPNNSGKSSILATLLMLKQSVEDRDPSTGLITSGPLVDLGSYFDIVPKSPEETPLEISFSLAPSWIGRSLFDVRFEQVKTKSSADEENTGAVTPLSTLMRGPQLFPHDSFTFIFHYDKKRNNVPMSAFTLCDTKTGRVLSGRCDDDRWTAAGLPEDLAKHLTISTRQFIPILSPSGPEPVDETIVQRAMSLHLQSILQAESMVRVFRRLTYVGPVRERIPHYGVLGTMPYSQLGPSGQNLMRVLAGQITLPGRRKDILAALNEWLDNKFRLVKNVRLKKLDKGGTVRALVAEDHQGHRVVNLASTGSGISQIVPVVVQTVMTPPHGCLIVEQPEIHLHPAAQATLADLFVEQLTRQRQYIIETHSEHFLLRLRRRVAEGKLKPDAIKIFAVEKTGGWTSVRELELMKNGHFKDWPSDFFEAGYQEALALAKASAAGATSARSND